MGGRFLSRLLPALASLLLLGASILAETAAPEGGSPPDAGAASSGPESAAVPAVAGDSAQGEAAAADGSSSGAGLAGEPAELLLAAGDGARLHLYDGEETAVFSSGSARSLVTMADGIFTRRSYDGAYRLSSRLTWREPEGEVRSPAGGGDEGLLLEPPRLVSQEDFYYHEDSPGCQRVVLTDFQGASRTERFFSPEGLLVREEFYRLVPAAAAPEGELSPEEAAPEGTLSGEEEPGGGNGGAAVSATDLPPDPWKDFPQLALARRTEYRYDGEQGLMEKVTTHLEGEESFSQRMVYHQPGNIHGGHDEFEDERLVVSRRYQDDGRYTETRYMDSMRIEAQYQGARLVSETIYLDGKELRRTEF